MDFEIINTDDGSKTIYLESLDETYHSTFGAINEAKHVYINNGLKQIDKSEIRVCEIGYGTGLNALLSLIFAEENDLSINYVGFEKYPLEKFITDELNYGDICKNPEYFKKINSVTWNEIHNISDKFTLTKIHADVLDSGINFPRNLDVIYFDAFAPTKQAEMWNLRLFSKLHESLAEDGFLVTYSAAGIVKEALRKAGFTVKRLAGPEGKFHMLLATKFYV